LFCWVTREAYSDVVTTHDALVLVVDYVIDNA